MAGIYIRTPEIRAKNSAGTTWSPEARAKMSASAKARSKESRQHPDRELIARRAKTARVMYNVLWRVRYGLWSDATSRARVGYTAADLRAHLEAQFTDGMTWENYGTAWETDHIRPIYDFLLHGITDPKQINALSNLRPLWREANLRKGRTYHSEAPGLAN